MSAPEIWKVEVFLKDYTRIFEIGKPEIDMGGTPVANFISIKADALLVVVEYESSTITFNGFPFVAYFKKPIIDVANTPKFIVP